MDTYVQCGEQPCTTANFSTSLMELTNINQPITKLLSNKDALWWAEPLQCCMQDKWHEHTWELPSAHCKESLRLSGEALIRFTSSWDSEFFLKPMLLSLRKKIITKLKMNHLSHSTRICYHWTLPQSKTKPFSWLRKMFFVLSQAQDMRNWTSDLQILCINALLLSYRDSTVSKVYYEVHMTCVLHFSRISNDYNHRKYTRRQKMVSIAKQ